MSPDILTSFDRLCVDCDADVGTIRRAYARELKLIDQQNDAPGFQQLRAADELAREWVKRPMTRGESRLTPPGGAADMHAGPNETVKQLLLRESDTLVTLESQP